MYNRIFNELLDLRDSRIRYQRLAAALLEKELWEPENITAEDASWLRYYRGKIALIKADEEELSHKLEVIRRTTK